MLNQDQKSEEMKNEEDTPCCRVCHGESEPDNQLFYPCNCDGSIKYVHQECLVQWLKVSRKADRRCELCGAEFHFQNVYKEGAPIHLSIYDLILEVFPRVLNFSKNIVSIVISSILWGIFLPLCTNWWFRFCWCLISYNDYGQCAAIGMRSINSFDYLSSAWYSGIVNICVIIAVTVICFEIGQIIYKELEIIQKSHRIKLLERQLAQNVNALRQYEEERRKTERRLFALEDYESLKYEWELEKYNNFNRNTSLTNPNNPLPPVPKHTTSLLIDRKFSRRMVQKLTDLCATPGMMDSFIALKGCYEMLDQVLHKKEVDDLITLSESIPNQPEDSLMVDPEFQALTQVSSNIHNTIPNSVLCTNEGGIKVTDDDVDIMTKSDKMSSEEMSTEQMSSRSGYERFYPRDCKKGDEYKGFENQKLSSDIDLLDEINTLGLNNGNENNEIPKNYKIKESEEIVLTLSAEEENHTSTENPPNDLMEPTQVENMQNQDKNENKDLENLELRGRMLLHHYNELERRKKPQIEDPVIRMREPYHATDDLNNALPTLDQWGPFLPHPDNLPLRDETENNPVPLTEQDQALVVEGVEAAEAVVGPVGETGGGGGGIINDDLLRALAENLPHQPNPPNLREDVVNMELQNVNDDNENQIQNRGPAARRPPNDIVNMLLPEGRMNGQMTLIQLFACLCFNCLFMIVLLVVPALIGKFLYEGPFVPDSWKLNAQDAISELLEQESNLMMVSRLFDYMDGGADHVMRDDKIVISALFYSKFKTLIEVGIGYSVYAGLALVGYLSLYVKYAGSFDYGFSFVEMRMNQIKLLTQWVHNLFKVKLIFLLYVILLPCSMTGLMGLVLRKNFPVPLEDTETGFILLGIFLYIFSYFFTAHVLYVSYELRHLLKKDLLTDFLPDYEFGGGPEQNPNNPQGNNNPNVQSLQERFNNLTFSRIVKRFMITCCLVLPGLLVFVIIPMRFGHIFCPLVEGGKPLIIRIHYVLSDIQIPVEMILSHILIPLLVEKLKYKATVRKILAKILKTTTPMLNLEWILAPEAFPEFNPVNLPVEDIPPPQDNELIENLIDQAQELENPVQEDQNQDNILLDEDQNPENLELKEEDKDVQAPPDYELNPEFSTKIFQIDQITMEEEKQENDIGIPKSLIIEDVKEDLDNFKLLDIRSKTQEDEITELPSKEEQVESKETLHEPFHEESDLKPDKPWEVSNWPIEIRVFLLIVSVMACLSILSSWAIHLPLYMGRSVLALCHIPTNNDIFNFPTGLISCWLCSFVGQYVWDDVMDHMDLWSSVKSLCRWVFKLVKLVGVGALWLSLPPLLLGLLLEAFFIIPFRTPLMETPQYPFIQCWALGLITLKLWTRCIFTGVFGENQFRTEIENLLIRGFANFDAKQALIKIFFPVTIFVSDLLLIPFFSARLISLFLHSYFLKTFFVRFSYHIYVILRVFTYLCFISYASIIKLHNEIRDNKYLVGTRLTNKEKN